MVELELTGANPFKRLGIVKPIGQQDAGLSFTYTEVRKLLSETHRLNDDLRDIIRLLACTGARLAEISGLEVQDVDTQEMTINIRFNATRRLKNNRSVRTVPVVGERAIEALRVRVTGKRLTDVVFPRYGREGGPDSASAALSKWLTRIGLRDTRARIPKTTRSLRHAFKDGVRDAGVHRDVANMIQGHTAGDEASKYGSSELLSRKREAAEQVWKLLLPPK